jgi:predicted DNA-binding transcriptional regulator AlpA
MSGAVHDLEGDMNEATVMIDATDSSLQRRQRGPRIRLPLTDDHAWNMEEVAYFLGVSVSTIRNLERDGELPALPRIRKRVTFDPKTIRAFRDGWRPPPGWRPAAPATQVSGLDGTRRAKR